MQPDNSYTPNTLWGTNLSGDLNNIENENGSISKSSNNNNDNNNTNNNNGKGLKTPPRSMRKRTTADASPIGLLAALCEQRNASQTLPHSLPLSQHQLNSGISSSSSSSSHPSGSMNNNILHKNSSSSSSSSASSSSAPLMVFQSPPYCPSNNNNNNNNNSKNNNDNNNDNGVILNDNDTSDSEDEEDRYYTETKSGNGNGKILNTNLEKKNIYEKKDSESLTQGPTTKKHPFHKVNVNNDNKKENGEKNENENEIENENDGNIVEDYGIDSPGSSLTPCLSPPSSTFSSILNNPNPGIDHHNVNNQSTTTKSASSPSRGV